MLAHLLVALLTLHPILDPLTPASPPPAPAWYGGRVYTSQTLHLGVRPNVVVDGESVGAAVTLQVTCDCL